MRLALWLAAALAVGIALAEWLRPHILLLAAVCIALTLLALRLSEGRRSRVALLLAVLAAGALRYAFDQTFGQGTVQAWAGHKVTLTGTVVSEPQLRGTRSVSYTVAVAQIDAHAAAGLVQVTQWSGDQPIFGERVTLAGRLKRPPGARTPGGFDQAEYLARQGVYLAIDTSAVERQGPGSLGWLRRTAVAARLRLEGVLRATLPPDQAALAAGLLFGSRTDLPEEIRQAFRTTGVFHLLAVSGGNVAMILLLPGRLLRRLGVPPRWVSAALIPLVIFFVFLTGAGPSVVRAGLMAVLVLSGEVLRREKDVVNTLGAAAALLLLVQPALLFDIGFQLSVSATLGILLFARPIERRLRPGLERGCGRRLGHWAAAGLSATLGAQVMVEPLSLYHFGAFSAIAPVANLVVLIFLEQVVQLGMAGTIAGLLSLPLATVVLLPVRLGLWLLVSLVKLIAAIPYAYLEVGRLPAAGVLVWYAVVAVLAAPRWQRALADRCARVRAFWAAGSWRERSSFAAALCLGGVTLFTWGLALADPPDLLLIHVVDVGQGDAILVEAPGGGAALIDAGPYQPPDPARRISGYDAGAEVLLPLLQERGIERLEYLILTHPDLDHAGGGAAVLAGVAVGTVLKSDRSPTERRYLEALAEAGRRGVPVRQPAAGDRLLLGGTGVVLEVLNPPAVKHEGTRSDDNANCLAIRLTYRKIAALFTCDLEAPAEERLLAEGWEITADLLKVAHHGSRHSTGSDFLKAVRPTWAVISAGNGNRYGHPHVDTLTRLADAGVQVLRTDHQGTIRVSSDGFTLQAVGSRREPAGARGAAIRPLSGRPWLGAW